MPLNIKDAKKASGGVVAPAGAHLARCYSLVDLGTHTTDGRYGKKTDRKLRFSWELPDEKHDFGKGPQPFVVHYVLNFTVGQKSALLRMLTSWRGRAFKPEELEDFDLKKLLGKPCLLTVVHNEKDGNVYANVDNVAPVPAKWREQMPPPITPTTYYEVSMGRNTTFLTLPDWLQQLIEKSEEWAYEKAEAKPTAKAADDDEPPDEIFGKKETEEDDDDNGDPF